MTIILAWLTLFLASLGVFYQCLKSFVTDYVFDNLNVRESLQATRHESEKYDEMFREYSMKYSAFE